MAKRKKLTQKELKEHKQALIKLREKIFRDMQALTKDTLDKSQKEAAGDLSGYTYHMADVASDTFEREFSLDLAANEQRLIYEIEEALKRIETNEYGFCLMCGEKIAKQRLKAIPYAQYCIKCQNKREKER
ncbi:MAG: TraR/DksA family transcriptional regulator [Candidatus Omnitrophica bacterium]|nr:TraR/DksA family transcriptional regulator [Candidatus Omnitrophota bacterium]MCM8797992.1 TraR/DksA family transcriptional regulator [Candidatus Omnitrophota bacterium]